MIDTEFIHMELSGFEKIKELECLIKKITDNGKYTLDFIDRETYGAQRMYWGTNIYYNQTNKIDGYLAHELFHANLYKQGFPNPKDFFDKNINIAILHKVIGPKSNCDLFNCLAHLKFHQDYLDCGFKENEFVEFYNHDLIESTDFDIFIQFYDKNNKYLNKLFIEKFISIKTDLNANRNTINGERLSKMRDIHFNLSNILDNLIDQIKTESNISNIEDLVKDFYIETNKICC